MTRDDDETFTGFLRRKAVADLLGISRHTLRRIIERDSTFPRFVQLSPGVAVVRKREIQRWLSRKELATLNRAQVDPR